jgi:hypothetical protein
MSRRRIRPQDVSEASESVGRPETGRYDDFLQKIKEKAHDFSRGRTSSVEQCRPPHGAIALGVERRLARDQV